MACEMDGYLYLSNMAQVSRLASAWAFSVNVTSNLQLFIPFAARTDLMYLSSRVLVTHFYLFIHSDSYALINVLFIADIVLQSFKLSYTPYQTISRYSGLCKYIFLHQPYSLPLYSYMRLKL